MSSRPKRRLMLFTDSFAHGGSERQFVQALRLLDRGRYDLLAGCLKRQGPLLADIEEMRIPVFEFPLQSLKSPANAAWLWRLARFLREQEVELVHTFEFYTSVMCTPAARLAGVPVVMSVRDVVRAEHAGLRLLLRCICAMADAVVINSRAAGARLVGRGPWRPEKFRLIYNSLDWDRLTPRRPRAEVRKSLGLPADAVAVGTLSTLRPEKGLKTFLHAAALAVINHPTTHFVIIGDGSERMRLEALAAELRLGHHIHFLGDRRDVADLLAAFDVFVLASSTESLPNATLEAMALGLPVVATRVGGTPELVAHGRTGVLVRANDAEATAREVSRLVADPALGHALGAAAREDVRERFAPHRMKDSLEKLYEWLLIEHRPTARILQIGNYPPPVCGWSLHTQLVQRELAGRGADSRVLDIGPGRRIPGRDSIPSYNSLDYAAKLLTYRLRGFTFHAHVNGDSWKGFALALAAVLLGRLTAKPSVLTFHAGPDQIYFPRARGFWHWAFRLLFHASGEVICNHEPVKQAILSYGVAEEKVHPIPAFSLQYSEDLPVPLPDGIERFLAVHQPRLFSYSLFRPEFTMEALFVAFAAVCRAHPRAGLVIAGPKEVHADALERMRELGIDADILIPGNLPHAEFLTAVQRSDVFVRTHLRDGVCTSVLEALQLGVPVVAAEDGLRPPSVITYAPGDAAALAHALVRVLGDLDRVRAQVRPPEVKDNLQAEIALLLAAGGARTFAAGGGEA